MLLHFIFLLKEKEKLQHQDDYAYIKEMSKFYKFWIQKNFLVDVEINCDVLIANKRNIIQRLDIPLLMKDHFTRDKNTYHFYLCYFKPIWTDCSCDGYHAENFGMTWWQYTKDNCYDPQLVQKNCAIVSHEISHELLRQQKNKKYIDIVHQIWSEHLFGELKFQQYDENFCVTENDSKFLTIDASKFNISAFCH